MNWDLSKLYSGFNDEQLLADTSAALEKLSALRTSIAALPGDNAAENLAAIIADLQEIITLQIKVGSFTFLTLAVDANNEEARAYQGRVIEMNIESAQVNSALSRYLGSIEDLDALISGNSVLEEHAFLLKEFKENAAHTIDPALEPTVLKLQMTGGTAWEQLRDQLDANLIIPF